jgi:hypothetical protein
MNLETHREVRAVAGSNASDSQVKNLLYISYGAGLHQQEIIFSLLSAWRWSELGGDSIRFLVFTDQPGAFDGLPVAVEHIPEEQWTEWSGPHRFKHRCKILALRHAFQKYPAATVLLDGDTWLRKAPQLLFDRIAPGRTVMHLREGKLMEIAFPCPREMAELLRRERFVDRNGGEVAIPPSAAIWNAGVVGLDPGDEGLLDDVLNLTDQFCVKSNLHILEQFAFSYLLEQKSDLQESGDVVFHYWPPYLHDPFRRKLPELLAKSAAMPLAERAAYCYGQRPRPTLARRGKVVAKRCLQALGFLPGGARSSEW